jgi:hypothetical protein
MARVECVFFRYKNGCNIAFIFKKMTNNRYKITRKWKVNGSYIAYPLPINDRNIPASQLQSFFSNYELNLN